MSFVAFEQRGPIGVLTMNRPEALNALNEQVLRDLDAALDAVAANDEVLVVILTGAGRSFVAGADIGQMKDLTPVQAKKFGSYGNQVFLKLENFPKPVIAAVNGFALGGGCELSMACDIRLASEKAKFGQPEVGLGITPGFGGTQRLPRIVGVSKAMELILTAKTIKADEAKAIGLVIPELNGKLIGSAQRVPVPTGSTTILVAVVKGKDVTKESINAAMKAAASESFGYNEDQIVSSDVIGMRYGSLFDATQTMVAKIDEDTYQVQVVSWYDNENSYTSQMVRTIKYFAENC